VPQEPVAGQDGDSFQSSGLLEQMGCSRHDLQPRLPGQRA
jgi:hypothetical protein